MAERPQTEDGIDCASLAVVAALPVGRFYPEGGEDVFQEMAGATIVAIGSAVEGDIEGGGLVIDYKPSGSEIAKRVVLAFNESGMWIFHQS